MNLVVKNALLAVLCLGLVVVSLQPPAVAAQVDDSPLPPAALDHFEREIRPLLVQRCYSCHSNKAKELKGELRLDHRDGVLLGGSRGPAIVPGDPEASLLLKVVNGSHSDLSMPPQETLTTLEIQSLAQWIRTGAVDPRDEASSVADADSKALEAVSMEESRNHWSFKPVTTFDTPVVSDVSRVRDPIDAFILEKLEELQLKMAPDAPLEVLARRAHQQLTGLPLRHEDLMELLDSDEPDAFDRYVDGLLASPAFGERWARSWLDLARYADSNGLDENLAFGEAWRYRDYVIRSFNSDKPYDRFLIEQIAGDLLPEPEQEQQWRDQRIATGFLTLGPKMLAEQDEEKLAIDVVDEQLDVVSRTFIGLTVGCARCHDHKFDPIPARDYYAMAGIFRSTSTMESLKTVAKWREISIESSHQKKLREEWEKLRAQLVKSRDDAKAQLSSALEQMLPSSVSRHLLAATAARRQIAMAGVTEASSTTLGENRSNYGTEQIPVLHSVRGGIQQATWKLEVPSAGKWSVDVRYAAMEKRPMRLLVNGEEIAKEALATVTGGWTPTHLRWESQAQIELQMGEVEIRLERSGAVPHLDSVRLVPVEKWPDSEEPLVVAGWVDFISRPIFGEDPLWGPWIRLMKNPVAGGDDLVSWWKQQVTEESLAEVPEAARDILLAAAPRNSEEVAALYQQLVEAAELIQGAGGAGRKKELKQLSQLLRSTAGPWFEPLLLAEKSAPPELKEPLREAQASLDDHDGDKPPAQTKVLGVQDDKIIDLPVHIRGSHLRLAKESVPRGALQITDGLVPPVVAPSQQSGRLELALWMTHPDHPLTSRVAVNRIWMELFGAPLVSTPSNFGLSGDTPSHPELLDHLAADFVAGGWSVKKLVRRILTTSSWRQQVVENPQALEIDPENRMLWSQNRQRLRAEAVRDSVLAVSDALDREMGGSLLKTKNRGYVTNDQSNNQATYDQPRRSVYLPVVRNAMYELFSAFDYNDPSAPIARRYSTVVPHQALFFLNSPMVLDSARMLARSAIEECNEEQQRVHWLYRKILARDASSTEVDKAIRFVENASVQLARSSTGEKHAAQEHEGWQAFAQVLLSSSEFLYID